MVHRGTNVYRVLGMLSLLIAVLLVIWGIQLDDVARNALLIVSVFVFVISFAYFSLSGSESHG